MVEVNECHLLERDGRLHLQTALGELTLDFVNDRKDYWRPLRQGKSELIARAIGIAKGYVDVVDGTLGLAQDAIVLARLGCRVRGVERSPWVAPLLQDALNRAKIAHQQDAKLMEWVQRVAFVQQDAAEYLRGLVDAERPQVVYLDPMFPGKKKDALPRKEMQIFRSVVGDDVDSVALLETALAVATERVVVKRPVKAPPLAGKPAHRFSGTSVCYDLYLTRAVTEAM